MRYFGDYGQVLVSTVAHEVCTTDCAVFASLYSVHARTHYRPAPRFLPRFLFLIGRMYLICTLEPMVRYRKSMLTILKFFTDFNNDHKKSRNMISFCKYRVIMRILIHML